MATALDKLSEKPAHFADCCPGVSKPLICAIVDHLPQSPALTLSIGSGSGLLEAILLEATERDRGEAVNLRGVEVPSCVNTHLPPERVLRVPGTTSLHPDVFLASCLMFVYPRNAMLIEMHLNANIDGAMEKLIWLGHRNDFFPEAQLLLSAAFYRLECIDGPGIPEYEVLVIASMPSRAHKQT